MRHDPASGAVTIMLRGLKMFGMAQAVADLVDRGAPAFEAAVPILSQLLKAEVAEREARSVACHRKAARLPPGKDLAGFDFAADEVNEATMCQLDKAGLLDAAENVVPTADPAPARPASPPPSASRPSSTAAARSASSPPPNASTRSDRKGPRGKAGQIAAGLMCLDLLIRDHPGYLPFSASEGALRIHRPSKLHERTGIAIFTSLG